MISRTGRVPPQACGWATNGVWLVVPADESDIGSPVRLGYVHARTHSDHLSLSLTTPEEGHHNCPNPIEFRLPVTHPRTLG